MDIKKKGGNAAFSLEIKTRGGQAMRLCVYFCTTVRKIG